MGSSKEAGVGSSKKAGVGSSKKVGMGSSIVGNEEMRMRKSSVDVNTVSEAPFKNRSVIWAFTKCSIVLFRYAGMSDTGEGSGKRIGGGKYEGGDGVKLSTGCLKNWCANLDTLPTLSTLLEVSGENTGLMLQVVHVEETEGWITITDGEAFCRARLLPKYLLKLKQESFGLHSIVTIRRTTGGPDDLVIVSSTEC